MDHFFVFLLSKCAPKKRERTEEEEGKKLNEKTKRNVDVTSILLARI